MALFKKFWMVLGDGTPAFQHWTIESAQAEAERLAKANPGSVFTVLEAVSRVKKSDVSWQQASDEAGFDIPF